jgi:hypothetical protein
VTVTLTLFNKNNKSMIESNEIVIGKGSYISSSARIRGVNGKADRIIIGDNTYIGDDVQIICNENKSKFKEGSTVILSNGKHSFKMEIKEDSIDNFVMNFITNYYEYYEKYPKKNKKKKILGSPPKDDTISDQHERYEDHEDHDNNINTINQIEDDLNNYEFNYNRQIRFNKNNNKFPPTMKLKIFDNFTNIVESAIIKGSDNSMVQIKDKVLQIISDLTLLQIKSGSNPIQLFKIKNQN